MPQPYRYTQLIATEVPEDQIDGLGTSFLRRDARARRLELVGDVTRVEDTPVVLVEVEHNGGTITKAVALDDPQADGRTEPDARRIAWTGDVEPIVDSTFVVLPVERRPGPLARGEIPEHITAEGGLIQFKHEITDPVLIKVYDARRAVMGVMFANEIKPGEHEVLLPPGAVTIQALTEDDNGTYDTADTAGDDTNGGQK